MKYLLMMSLLAFSVGAFAEKIQGENFEAAKARMLENINKRISQLETDKSCANAAKSLEDLKKCRKQGREARRGSKNEWKMMRKDKRKEKKSED